MAAKNGFWLSILLLILSIQTSYAQHQINIHALADKLYTNNQINGAILVLEEGKCILKRASGLQNPAGNDSLDLSTPFNLGEASNVFTAMAIALLQQRNLLDWDDRVARHLKDLPYQNIRIRDLLWHTSGLPDYFLLCERYWDRSRPINNHDLIDLIRNHEPRLQFSRGISFEYSNTNYALLALIVERISKIPFATFIQKEIFEPLEMHDAFVYRPFSTTVEEESTTGFRLSLRKQVTSYPPNYLDGIVGDKGIYVSINDMHKWLLALQSHRLLSHPEVETYLQSGQLLTGEKTFYAMGWVRIDSPEVAFHDGAWRGFHSTIVWYTKTNHAIVMLSNRSDRVVHMQRMFSRILEGKSQKYFWKKKE
jgi:CubicO group peptidase (beta-lactamase class C family)